MHNRDANSLVGNILIVDDTPANLRLLSHLLGETGHTVRAVTSGIRALEAVRANPPDVILLDVSMPVMSGYEVCENLKQDVSTQDIPIIFISALGNTEDKLRAFTAGGVDYITKPFQVKEVLARVSTHLALRDLQKQLTLANQAMARQLDELAISNAALQTRNEELDAFAHTVAHDLKNPLNFLSGYGGLLVNEYDTMPRDEILLCARGIANGATKLELIIDSLLLLSSVRKMSVEMHILDMEQIVSEALKRLPRLIEERDAVIELPQTWPVVWGYAPWVEEIWANYISNAIKYGGDPPHVVLGATSQPDGWVRFWVRDNGIGISLEDQQRLFTPFERLHQANIKGHGLGLSIVQRIAQKLCGNVGVDSKPKHGSKFYFTLLNESSPPDMICQLPTEE
jgi:signal transduction histidine kinase